MWTFGILFFLALGEFISTLPIDGLGNNIILNTHFHSGNYPRSSTHFPRGALLGLPSSAIFMQLWWIDPRTLVLNSFNR